ncbi:MAG: glycosyltransferase family 39 protein [Anaerolineae bacterium]|nr:glycosyltransferase family 39 protein [Anaerolineae bacterium]
MNSRWFYVGIEAVLLIVAAAFWWRKGRPNLAGPLKKDFLKHVKMNLREHPDLILLSVGVGIGLILLAVLAYVIPTNNNDSISTHAVRIAYWLQHGNYRPWDTPRIWQIVYPVNAQLVMYWTLLFSGSDHWLAFIQYSGGIMAALSVIGIARTLIKDQPAGAIFSGLLFLTLPVVVLQMTTTQNDLITAAFVGMGFYFFVHAIEQDDLTHFILSGAVIGIAIGIKQTLLFLLPGWGAACLLLWLWYKKVSLQRLLQWGVSILVFFVLLSSQIYVMNFLQYGSPFGPKEVVGQVTQATESVQTAATQVGLNTTRFLYQFADPSGLPSPLWRWGIKIRTLVGERLFGFLNIPLDAESGTTPPHRFKFAQAPLLHEDEAWYGILGFFLLVPTLITTFIWGLKKKEPISLTIFIITAGFFLFVTLLRPGWDPFQGRYFMPVVLLCSSLFVFWFTKKSFRWTVVPLSAVVGLLILFNAVLYNPAKPFFDTPYGFYYRAVVDPGAAALLDHRETIFEVDRIRQISFQNPETFHVCQMIEDSIPSDGVMGYMINASYYQEYCFFGEHFQRTVIPLQMDDLDLTKEEISENSIEYLLCQGYSYEECLQLEGYTIIDGYDSKLIFIFQKD